MDQQETKEQSLQLIDAPSMSPNKSDSFSKPIEACNFVLIKLNKG
jgi:hypothetical protein